MDLDQQQLLKSWQRYIEITGCEKSKIPVNTIVNCQNVHFKDSDLYENAKSHGVYVELNPDKVVQLNQKYVVFDEESKESVLIDSLSFAFPLLTIHERGRSFYLPLFICDLPTDFLVSDRCSGFSISSNLPETVKLNISVFTNYFDVDADDIDESRNLIDLVALICGEKFVDFRSMYRGLIDWANKRLQLRNNDFKEIFFAPNTDGLIYAQQNEDTTSNLDLVDFKYLLSQVTTHGVSVIQENYPLLSEYIKKNGYNKSIVLKHPVHSMPTFGLFESKYSLGRGQFQAIQAANITPKLPLIAVQGAPGTGKTTLFKSLIAQQITARALSIINDKDQNMNMLVCSTAIKAVDNVIADLKAEDFTQDLNWLWFHGGANQKVSTEITERVEPHIAELEANPFNEPEYNQLQKQILELQSSIFKIVSDYTKLLGQLNTAKKKIPFIPTLQNISPYNDDELNHVLDEFLKDHKNRLDPNYKYSISNLDLLNSYEAGLIERVYTLKDKIKHLSEAQTNIQAFLNYWPQRFTTSQFSDWMLKKKVRGNFSVKFGDYINLLLIKLLAAISPAKANLIDACNVLSEHDQINVLQHKVKLHLTKLEIISQIKSIVENVRHFYSTNQEYLSRYNGCSDITDVLRLKAIHENRKIFELSIKFLYQEQLKQKTELIEALNHWSAMLKGEKTSSNFGKYIKQSEKFYKLISLAYPVVASTLASAYKMSGYRKLEHLKDTKPWNLVLLDEAGMVSVENLVPIMSRSTTAMIVGDPLQLEPIRTISKPSAQKIYHEFFQHNDEAYAMQGPGQVTAYHRAAGTLTGEVRDIGDGIVLDEHRRCQAPIAQLFIDIAKYKGISVSTFKPSERVQKAFESLNAHHLMFYHVDGLRESGKSNLDEVRAIGELLNQLEAAGYNLCADIGIITPYADQKRLLINAYGKRMEQSQLAKIGTIHQFQGVGFEVIIFSPVIFEESDSSTFLNSRPNMLNVAVSRAKQQFIVVGNYQKLKNSKGALGLIAERASQDFYLELGYQSPSFGEYSESFAVDKTIHNEQHIKAFEQYLSLCQKSFYVIVPWIRNPINGSPQKQLELLKATKERGVEVKVFYGYNNVELNKSEDNDKDLVQTYITALGVENVVRLPSGTHEKVLLIDDRILVVGSWNWLSNAYYKWYGNNDNSQANTKANLAIRRETSIITMDRKLISEYKSQNLTEIPEIHNT